MMLATSVLNGTSRRVFPRSFAHISLLNPVQQRLFLTTAVRRSQLMVPVASRCYADAAAVMPKQETQADLQSLN